MIGDGMSVVFNIHTVTLRQTVLPREVLGRANAAITACTSGVTPVAAILAGALAEATSVRFAIWIGMALPLAVPFVLWRLRRIKKLPWYGACRGNWSKLGAQTGFCLWAGSQRVFAS